MEIKPGHSRPSQPNQFDSMVSTNHADFLDWDNDLYFVMLGKVVIKTDVFTC